MKIDISKIKIPNINFKNLFSSSPRDLWNGFLWFLVFAVILVMVFDVWIYFHFLNSQLPDAGDIGSLKTQSFDKALERMEEKRSNTEKYKSGFVIEDPS